MNFWKYEAPTPFVAWHERWDLGEERHEYSFRLIATCKARNSAAMAPQASWVCCFRPKVTENAGEPPKIVKPSKCTEDSANADVFARLHCRPIRTDGDTMEDADEDFASPASSYQTCFSFSEQDPLDLSEMSRCFLLRSHTSSLTYFVVLNTTTEQSKLVGPRTDLVYAWNTT